jgi:hypothetical protein
MKIENTIEKIKKIFIQIASNYFFRYLVLFTLLLLSLSLMALLKIIWAESNPFFYENF